MIRQPIVSILGHVDHGKTSLLDTIRGSAVASREAGGITQAIGASIIPLETIKAMLGDLLAKVKMVLEIPGLLFIDTPGHAAFVNLRKRGGNLADIAILVVDINEGLKPQTIESIAILKQYKTPFLVAANKIDVLAHDFASKVPLLGAINKASAQVQGKLDIKLYELVGQLSEQGLNADRFDRVSDYTKQIAIVPISAKSGIGVPELLMVMVGLTQKYLEKQLTIDPSTPAKGTVLEIKEEQGLGTTVDVILYEGSLNVGDTIVVGGLQKSVVAKIKSLLQPLPLKEMREKKTKFSQMKSVVAATGVKIAAPGLDGAVSGVPIIGVPKGAKADVIAAEIEKEIKEIAVQTDGKGVIIKADSLGSLEALSFLLKEQKIPVVKASVGAVTKKDIHDAEVAQASDPLTGAILGFNIPEIDLPVPASVHVIRHDVIYRLIEDYVAWRSEKEKALQRGSLDALTKPAKIQLLKGYVFRQSNPAIVGVEVLAGTIRTGARLMNKQGVVISDLRGLQLEQESVTTADKGARVAASLSDVIVGRQIQEGDILYSVLTEEEFRKYKEMKEFVKADQKEVLREIAEIMREKNPVWGI